MRSSAIFAAGVILGFLLAIGVACKAQTYLIGSGIAFHLDGGTHCNEHVTPGFGVEQGVYAFGIYDNSNCKVSAYAARYWTPIQIGALKLGSIAGLVSGYTKPILPVGGLVASLTVDIYKLNLIFIPPVGTSGNVLWFQIGTAFD